MGVSLLPLENDLLRLKILWELYQSLFNVCYYGEIQTQRYKIESDNISNVLAALYYLDNKGYINVRNTKEKDVLIIYIRSRGIDEIEDRWKRGNMLLFGSAYNNILVREVNNENSKD
ncbi:hypothetical protein [Clostridium algidicarnis]|uniref:YjcQ protein n=2 Tax=Clostridium algidicarnis TaxID=37659 RepID=A0A2S6FZP1_9CLOT|nr:hypothetical protein [Clostridium algidicarnis]MBB6632116.1 hypothetical protein [Clostridium algidicarnis]MBB6697824.1 hypothetical protein [Clostridium algidicarnis]MBU3196327.1 hypothetical protein [Clostridium algidicarnis]MBU3206724.1 hypothetical protein [Clostridium algidicarnis]MBU3220557.1 hypothetical protein [Clostridium algidicarnis]